MNEKTRQRILQHEQQVLLVKKGLPPCIRTREFRQASPTVKRPCAACGLKRECAGGPDPCLVLENVCCGHRVVCGYIMFENGLTIRGVFHTDEGPGPGSNIAAELDEIA